MSRAYSKPPFRTDVTKRFIYSADDQQVAAIQPVAGSPVESMANADLFAAASEMLEALKQIEDEINRTGSPSLDGWDKARAAIAKATEGAS